MSLVKLVFAYFDKEYAYAHGIDSLRTAAFLETRACGWSGFGEHSYKQQCWNHFLLNLFNGNPKPFHCHEENHWSPCFVYAANAFTQKCPVLNCGYLYKFEYFIFLRWRHVPLHLGSHNFGYFLFWKIVYARNTFKVFSSGKISEWVRWVTNFTVDLTFHKL